MAQLLQTQFHDIVSALVHSAARAQAELDRPGLQPPYNDLTQFVLGQHARMPDYLRAPLLAATLAFDLFGLVGTGHRFHQLGPQARARQLAAWKQSKSGFKRDLI